MSLENKESGHALFYLLLILPILTSLSIIIFDISQWLALRNHLQRQADHIATLASRSLPDTDLAKKQIESLLEETPQIAISESDPYIVSPSEVRFTLVANSSALFDFLLSLTGSSEIIFQAKQEVRAQVVPGDYLIILSDSASLRPKPYAAWSDHVSWPASEYFNLSLPPLTTSSGNSPNYTHELWNQLDFKRWATQQCYNPIFSPMKLGAAILSDILLRQPNNRVSALFSPGAIIGNSFEQAIELEFLNQRISASRPSWFSNTPASWFGDESCIYISDPHQNFLGEYAIPTELYSFRDIDPTCSSAALPLYLANHTPMGRVNDCFRYSVSLPERIYYRAAQDREHDITGEMLLDSIEQALNVFTQLSTEHEITTERRGNLRAISKRMIIAIVDTMIEPSESFNILLEKIRLANVQLYIIFNSHQNLDTDVDHISGINLNLPAGATIKSTLDSRFRNFEQTYQGLPYMRVATVSDSEELLHSLIPKIIEESRDVTISQ